MLQSDDDVRSVAFLAELPSKERYVAPLGLFDLLPYGKGIESLH